MLVYLIITKSGKGNRTEYEIKINRTFSTIDVDFGGLPDGHATGKLVRDGIEHRHNNHDGAGGIIADRRFQDIRRSGQKEGRSDAEINAEQRLA